MIDNFPQNEFRFYILVYISPKLVATALFLLPLLFGFIKYGAQVWCLPELVERSHVVGGRCIQI
jgi:hypothetical protein